MKYKLLGRSGLRVSEVSLGGMTFGTRREFGAGKEESLEVLKTFTDAGGNFIDTADMYHDGDSELLLAEWMGKRRDEYVIATKFSHASGRTNDPNFKGNNRKAMMQSVEASLKRLATDHIDLYWMHSWDGITPAEEVMQALDDLVRQGKVLYIGLSDTPAWVISRSQMLAELRGWASLAAVQLTYNLLKRDAERELLPMARQLGLSVTPWGVLADGLLTGKYKREGNQEGRLTAGAFTGRGFSEENFAVVDKVVEFAQARGVSPSQVALAWLRSRGDNIIPILGARTAAQLKDNLGCLTLELSAEELATLTALKPCDLGFPGDFYTSQGIERLLFGETRDLIEAPRPVI
jgi:aryl-alcohol dehydrogenase-like predicted oxidoreductase